MIRRKYICNQQNPHWPVGQFFIVDEDREFCMPAKVVQTGPRTNRLQAVGMIEIPFDEKIKPFCIEIGLYGQEADDDASPEFII